MIRQPQLLFPEIHMYAVFVVNTLLPLYFEQAIQRKKKEPEIAPCNSTEID